MCVKNKQNKGSKVSLQNETDFPITYQRGKTIGHQRYKILQKFHKNNNSNNNINNNNNNNDKTEIVSLENESIGGDNTETDALLTVNSDNTSDHNNSNDENSMLLHKTNQNNNDNDHSIISWKEKYIPDLNKWETMDILIASLIAFVMRGIVISLVSWLPVYLNRKFDTSIAISAGSLVCVCVCVCLCLCLCVTHCWFCFVFFLTC